MTYYVKVLYQNMNWCRMDAAASGLGLQDPGTNQSCAAEPMWLQEEALWVTDGEEGCLLTIPDSR